MDDSSHPSPVFTTPADDKALATMERDLLMLSNRYKQGDLQAFRARQPVVLHALSDVREKQMSLCMLQVESDAVTFEHRMDDGAAESAFQEVDSFLQKRDEAASLLAKELLNLSHQVDIAHASLVQGNQFFET
eukprot:TRINITY_DN14468_c0_g1_i1.p1 TRINITY_DN14468_c0_g1~~TRINITY_DN14468_c0_g1_i1.p1  ORF type:complete len:133 (-),score=27.39 TRINITY_DN14468_c0_g1_i1:157-555(-)